MICSRFAMRSAHVAHRATATGGPIRKTKFSDEWTRIFTDSMKFLIYVSSVLIDGPKFQGPVAASLREACTSPTPCSRFAVQSVCVAHRAAAIEKAKRAPRFLAKPSRWGLTLCFRYYGYGAKENGQGVASTKLMLLLA
jgi:hypothetical protein